MTREAELIEEVTGLLGKKHGGKSIECFGPVDLEELREWLIEQKDWARKKLNKQIVRLVAMFKWAVKKELLCACRSPATGRSGRFEEGSYEGPRNRRRIVH